MTNSNLTLVIDAINNSSAALRAVRNDLKGIETQTQKTAQSVGFLDTFTKRVFTLAAVRIGAQAIRGALSDTTKAYAEQARALTQLNAVLKSTGGAAGVTAEQAIKLSEGFQKSTRIMDEQVLSAENILLTFTNIKDNIFPETTQAVLDMATSMNNGAVPSLEQLTTTSIQVGKALQDPIQGVSALQRVGVRLTEQQKEQVKSLVETGHAMDAQKIILAELNKEFGGSAAAMTPFERNMDSIKDKVADAQEALGQLVQGGVNLLFQVINEHSGDIKRVLGFVGVAFGVLKEQVETHIGGIIGTINGLVKIGEGFADVFSDLAHGRWSQAWNSLKDVAVTAMKTMANAVAAIFGAIPNLAIDAINLAINEINKLSIPEINVAGRNLNPISGGLNVPTIPRINTQPFSIENQLKAINDAAVAADAPMKQFKTDIDDAGAAAKTAGELMKGLMSALSSAASDLFGGNTREQAQLKLQKLQLGSDTSQFMGGVTGATGTALANFQKQQAVAQKMLDAQVAAIDKQLDDLDKQHEIMKLQLELANKLQPTEAEVNRRFQILRDITSEVTGSIAGVGRLMDGAFRDSIEKIIKAAKELGTGRADGSYAGGLASVPYDGYKAILHKGERVLTAAQNRDSPWFADYDTFLKDLVFQQGPTLYRQAMEQYSTTNNNQQNYNFHISRWMIQGIPARSDIDKFVGGFAR